MNDIIKKTMIIGNRFMKKIAFGILAHVDAGKTTLAESILYSCGAIRNQGRVDNKDSTLDTHSLEKQRGITIFAGEASFTLGDLELTLLDTPGHVDFSAETERTLSVIDYAIVVISAIDGIQAHTRTVWKLLKNYNIPTFVFVTKCDLGRSSKDDILLELENEFGNVNDFSEENGEFIQSEKIAMCDDVLLEEYLSDGTFSATTVSIAINNRKIFPCFFGSGLKNQGVTELCSAIEKYVTVPDYPTEFSAKVFKISHDKNERLTKIKVTGGTLKVKDSIEYFGMSEKVNQIRIYNGAKFKTVNEAEAGTICTVTGLTKTFAGQILGKNENASASILEPVMRYKIILPDDADPHTMLSKFKILEEEDPKLNITYNELLGEFYCSLMGKIQAEIFKSIVLERFDVKIEIAEGSVIYKETIENEIEGVGHYEPLRHYAEVHLLIEPLEKGKGLVFDTKCSENALDRNWQRLILTHLAEKQHLGVLTGSPITDVKITLASGKAHLKHTEGGDFRQATYRAVRQGLMNAKNVLLEPYYSFRLEIPLKHIGRAISDIKLMGGNFDPPQSNGEFSVLVGKAPVIAMDGYMSEIASYTGGLGKLSLEFCGYDLCHNAEEVIEQKAYNPESDVENTADSVFCSHGAGFNVKWNKVPEYMHLESCLSKKQDNDSLTVHRQVSLDEKELERIMLKEFGKVETVLYRTTFKEKSVDETESTKPIKRKCLIVDGYNVIFAWESLKEISKVDLGASRDKLLHILSNYAHFTGHRIVIVFDGYKVSGNLGEKTDFQGLNVVYTKENETADTYIENLIAEIGQNEQVRVVTSDSMIQLSAVRTGVYRMSSAEFEKEIELAKSKMTEFLEENQ